VEFSSLQVRVAQICIADMRHSLCFQSVTFLSDSQYFQKHWAKKVVACVVLLVLAFVTLFVIYLLYCVSQYYYNMNTITLILPQILVTLNNIN